MIHEDYEYTNDEIYLMEKRAEMEAEWYEEESRRNRKAKINIGKWMKKDRFAPKAKIYGSRYKLPRFIRNNSRAVQAVSSNGDTPRCALPF